MVLHNRQSGSYSQCGGTVFCDPAFEDGHPEAP